MELRCNTTREERRAYGTYGDTGTEEPGNKGHVPLPRVRGSVRHSWLGRRDEHVRSIPTARDVWNSDERFPAIRGSSVEYSGSNPIQVRETAWLPTGLPDLSHETARLLRSRARFRATDGIPQGGFLRCR